MGKGSACHRLDAVCALTRAAGGQGVSRPGAVKPAGAAQQVFGIPFFPQVWVPHPSAFFAEGWASMNLDYWNGSRILP
jgi:hypothetical protein